MNVGLLIASRTQTPVAASSCEAYIYAVISIIKYPSAWLPVALSLIVLVLWVVQFAMHGPPARQADEGIAAHLFQIWLALEGVLVAIFAVRWMPRSFQSALPVLAIQLGAAAAACAPVFYFNL